MVPTFTLEPFDKGARSAARGWHPPPDAADFRAGSITLARSELEGEDLDALGAMAGHADKYTTDGYDRPSAPRVTRSKREAARTAHRAWLRAVERDIRDRKNRPQAVAAGPR